MPFLHQPLDVQANWLLQTVRRQDSLHPHFYAAQLASGETVVKPKCFCIWHEFLESWPEDSVLWQIYYQKNFSKFYAVALITPECRLLSGVEKR